MYDALGQAGGTGRVVDHRRVIEGGVFSSSASNDNLKQTAFLDSCLFRDTFLGLDSVIFPTSITGGVIYAEQLTLTHTAILGSVIQGPPKATAMEQDGIDLDGAAHRHPRRRGRRVLV